MEEGQTTQWSNEKEQKDKQRPTKHTHKTKDRVTWTPLKTGSELIYIFSCIAYSDCDIISFSFRTLFKTSDATLTTKHVVQL